MDDFPSNSRTTRITNSEKTTRPSVEEIKLEPVVTGKVLRRKKSLGRRLKETFFSGDSSSVFGYLLREVLIPALQATATDMVTQGIEKAVYGEVRTHRSSVRGTGLNRPHISYDRQSTINRSTTGSSITPRRPVSQPSAFDIGEVILGSKIETQVVMDKLYETIEEYGAATVANLNELIGQTSQYTDHKWGWTDLSAMTAKPIREGYLLILPDPEDLR